MAKPIVVMYIPENGYFDTNGVTDMNTIVHSLMSQLNGNYGRSIVDGDTKIIAPDYWKDYYWFVYPKRDIDEPQLQVFYEKDFTPIKFEELKKFIEDTLKAEKTQA